MELKWYCALCEQFQVVKYSGYKLPWTKSPRETAKLILLEKVDTHIAFHCWQLGNEIEYGWLEEDQE